MSTSSAAESLGSSADCPESPELLDITLILPDGQQENLTVQANKQMMDLLIQLSASHKLSPAGHILQAYDPDTRRQIPYKASQTLGSLGINILHLASKHNLANSETKRVAPSAQRPFDMTHRVTVNLPRNQKHVMRVKPSMTLAQIFQQTCEEKNLDPYKYELQHPSDPMVALNMADSLQVYAPLAELTLVSISGADSRLRRTRSQAVVNCGCHGNRCSCCYGNRRLLSRSEPNLLEEAVQRAPTPPTRPALSAPSLTSTMPKKKTKEQPEESSSYMPGMKEKKKKGIFSIFSRKKGSKFDVAAESSNRHSMVVTTASPPQPREVPRARPQSELIPSAAVPTKPPRKKRPAPPPPSSLQQRAPVHSRSSSHSSGFGEGSPGTVVRPEVTQPHDALSVDSADTTIQRRKKRAAPAPPPPVAAASVAPAIVEVEVAPEPVETPPRTPSPLREEETPNGEEVEEDVDEEDSAFEVTASSSKFSTSGEVDFHAHLSPDVIEELKQECSSEEKRPQCQFTAPPPPLYTPPPLELGDRLWGMAVVSDTATQVHVTSRDTLSSDSCWPTTPSTEELVEDDIALPRDPTPEARASPQQPETPEEITINEEQSPERISIEEDKPSSIPTSRKSSSSSISSSIMNYKINESDAESEDEEEVVPNGDGSVVLLKLNSTEEEVEVEGPKKRVIAAPLDLVIDKDEFLEDDVDVDVDAVLYNHVKVAPRLVEDEELAVIEEHEYEDQIADEIMLDDDVDYVEPVKSGGEELKNEVDLDNFKEYPSIKRKDDVGKNLVVTETVEEKVAVELDQVVVPVVQANSLREAMRQPPKPVPIFQKDPAKKSGDFGNSMFLNSYEAGSSPKADPSVEMRSKAVDVNSFVVKPIIRPADKTTDVVNHKLDRSEAAAVPSPPVLLRSSSQVDQPTVTEEDRKRVSFWGPRPWSAREHSLRTVSSSLQNLPQRPNSVVREGSPDMLDSSDRRMMSAQSKVTESVKQEDVVHYNSTGDIKTPKDEDEGITADTSNKKKTLQVQYADLQQQFTKWQQQIVDNQQLLARKKIIPEETVETPKETPHRRLIKADSDVVIRHEPTSPNARPSSAVDLPANTALASRFSGQDLAVGRANLRQNSEEEHRVQSMVYGADGRKHNLSKKGGFTIGSAYHGVSLSSAQLQPDAPSPPPPPPAPSTLPRRVIRPPVESLLDPREELMISIRNKGGMAALRKVPVDATNW